MKIFYNGNVYDEDYNLKEAFVVDNDKFVYVGSNENALKYQGEKVDLAGKYVLPGFNDSHMHIVGYGQFLSRVNLTETKSVTEVLDKIKEKLENGNKYVLGRGWNQDYFTGEKRYPTKKELDNLSKDTPIAITRVCGHILIANSAAIKIANIDKNSENYDLENGIFKDDAMPFIYDAIIKENKEDVKNYILNAQEKLHQFGITSVQSDDLVNISDDYQLVLDSYKELINENKLTLRVHEQCQFVDLNHLKQFIKDSYYHKMGDSRFCIGPIKIISDGSLGARSAYLSEPYHDDATTRGIKILNDDDLYNMIKCAKDHDFPIAIHTIGDGAVDQVLQCYQKLPNIKDDRSGLVHVQVTRHSQLELMKKLYLHAYIQSLFLDYDAKIVYQRLSEDLANSSYQFKTLFDNNHASNGSDCPIEIPNVLKGIQLAITRTPINEKVPYLKNQALSIKEALDSYTKNGAYASFEEHIKGSIKKGMLADFTVIDKDILKQPEDKIIDINVLATYVGGVKVYEK